MDSSWKAKLNQPTFAATAELPMAAASQVRVFQRYYCLGAPAAH
jgi:hypothetical protein